MTELHHACVLYLRLSQSGEALRYYGDTSDSEVSFIIYPLLGIQEVRSLTTTASLRPASHSHRLLVVQADNITFEAQQALLKLLEEPPLTTRFLFIIPPEINILPTLTSRFNDITPKATAAESRSAHFETFWTASYAERLALIQTQLTKKDSDWVQGVAKGLAQAIEKGEVTRTELPGLAFVLEFIGTRGASDKMLLEELALSLPGGAKKPSK